MPILSVSYDLDERGEQAYAKLIAALRKLDSRHVLKSTWYVAGAKTAVQLGEYLKPYLDQEAGDKIDIHRVDPAGGWSTMGLTGDDLKWIKTRFERARRPVPQLRSRLPVVPKIAPRRS